MKSRIKIAAAAAAALVGGLVTGNAIAAENDSPESTTSKATDIKYEEDLEPYTVLSNGKTAGNYRLETPLSERPDFVPTRLPNGKPGYLRLQDFDSRIEVEALSVKDGVTELSKSESDRLQAGPPNAAKPNARGEIFAPVYASDGVTVIGSQLMNPPE